MGIDCELNIDDCRNVRCQNGGQCVDGVAEYFCHCADGWTGKL